MKHVTVFFSSVGRCPWWCSDTNECGHESGRVKCYIGECDYSLPPPKHCPCLDVPDVQQLKTEFAVLVSELDSCLNLNRVTCATLIVNKLRQLS